MFVTRVTLTGTNDRIKFKGVYEHVNVVGANGSGAGTATVGYVVPFHEATIATVGANTVDLSTGEVLSVHCSPTSEIVCNGGTGDAIVIAWGKVSVIDFGENTPS